MAAQEEPFIRMTEEELVAERAARACRRAAWTRGDAGQRNAMRMAELTEEARVATEDLLRAYNAPEGQREARVLAARGLIAVLPRKFREAYAEQEVIIKHGTEAVTAFEAPVEVEGLSAEAAKAVAAFVKRKEEQAEGGSYKKRAVGARWAVQQQPMAYQPQAMWGMGPFMGSGN